MINLLWALLRAELHSKQGTTKRRFVRGIKDHNNIQQFLSSLVKFLLPRICSYIPTPLCSIFIFTIYLSFLKFLLIYSSFNSIYSLYSCSNVLNKHSATANKG